MKCLPALFFIFLISCGGEAGPAFYEKQRVLMGTVFKIKAFRGGSGKSREEFSAIAEKAFGEVARLESELSEWRADSPVSAAAADAGLKPVKITPDTARVVELALGISAETRGAFDISFKPLGKLWDVKKRKVPPAAEEIEKALALVDYRNVVLNSRELTLFLKKRGMAIGLGGIAKGYAAGKAGEILKKAGLNDFVVDAGGDLYYSGSKGGERWTGGIKDPKGGLFLKFRVKRDCAVVTSGGYENFFVHEGRIYHHIIDTATGYPAQGPVSVTVFAQDPALADAYATSFFVLGYEKALGLVKEKKEVEFILIDSGSRILKSPDIGKYAEIF
ncbi:MAG: FAD:protein FMN transferase [Elusimicrobia bacterium CG08_land_8_20_14_0_20_59_10]|nr:MAG: FAD:protein FMN transferase [Elusimicrobia bacterium CG08_land_8_20_14_0_20_59_10]